MNFIDTSSNPYKYYLDVLKSSLSSMVKGDKEMCEKLYQAKVAEFEAINDDIPSPKIAPNNKDRILRLACYVCEFVFKDALLNTITDSYGYPVLTPGFGVEYYTYDFEGEFTSKEKPYYRNETTGYYIESRNKLFNKIKFQHNANETLTKPDNYGYYGVIDFKALTRRLKDDINAYYRANPDLTTNLNSDQKLQAVFGKVLGELSASLMKGRNQQYNRFNRSF